MNKLFLGLSIIMLVIAFGNFNSVSADSIYLVNENEIEISYENYNHLKQFGFSEKEIMEIEYDEYCDFMSKEIISSYVETKNIKTTYTIRDGEIVKQTDVLLSEEEMDLAVKEALLSRNKRDAAIDDDLIINFANTSFLTESNEDGLTYVEKTYIDDLETSDYKIFCIYGVYYYNADNDQEFFVKTTMDWAITPSKRYVDLLTLGWNADVQIKAKYFPSSGNEYPDFYACFEYNQTLTFPSDPAIITPMMLEVAGDELSDYSYDIINKPDQVGVGFDLPENDYWGYYEGDYLFAEIYDNFHLKMEAIFSTKSTVNGITFGSSYQHQISSGTIDWGNITISTSFPFFEYSGSWLPFTPSFDAGIYGLIMFDNLT